MGVPAKRKVIQWATGAVGLHGLKAIVEHPDLELVGLVVHDLAKAGQDAGAFFGGPPTGVVATTDVNAALNLDADVVSYMATGDIRMGEAIDDMCAALAHGKNVVASAVVPLVYPAAFPPDLVARLEKACREGSTSCFTSGIDPGFANDVLPLALSGLCRRIDTIRVQEIFNYATYPQPAATFDLLGMGHPLDYEPLIFQPGMLSFAWGPVVHQLAAGVGLELESIRASHERLITDRKISTPVGVVEAGTVGAFRWQLAGAVGGEERIFVEHITRMHDDLAPEWPQPRIHISLEDRGFGGASGQGQYRVLIEGSPTIHCDLEVAQDHDHDQGARVATASRLINAVVAVCDAPPGLLSALELPLITGRG